jgi:hypothetical protein
MPRPLFSAAWAASQRIYAPANSADRVAKMIGGNVEKNIEPEAKYRTDRANFWSLR